MTRPWRLAAGRLSVGSGGILTFHAPIRAQVRIEQYAAARAAAERGHGGTQNAPGSFRTSPTSAVLVRRAARRVCVVFLLSSAALVGVAPSVSGNPDVCVRNPPELFSLACGGGGGGGGVVAGATNPRNKVVVLLPR